MQEYVKHGDDIYIQVMQRVNVMKWIRCWPSIQNI